MLPCSGPHTELSALTGSARGCSPCRPLTPVRCETGGFIRGAFGGGVLRAGMRCGCDLEPRTGGHVHTRQLPPGTLRQEVLAVRGPSLAHCPGNLSLPGLASPLHHRRAQSCSASLCGSSTRHPLRQAGGAGLRVQLESPQASGPSCHGSPGPRQSAQPFLTQEAQGNKKPQ